MSRLRDLIDALPDPIAELDPLGALLPFDDAPIDPALAALLEAHPELVRTTCAIALATGTPQHRTVQGTTLSFSLTRRQTVAVVARAASDDAVALDQFLYIASHDLREPMRKIISLAPILREDITALDVALTDDIREELAIIEDAAARMRQLILDLLVLSRTRRADFTPCRVPLRKIISSALEMQPSDAATLTWDEEQPQLWCDPVLMTRCYEQLIGNALTFAHPDRAPRLHFSACATQGGWTIGVRDNGIGFKPRFAEQIFQAFQRLHTREQYPGTGIGLAICAVIVARHGGRIWAEGAEGEGAHFQMFLPDPTPHHSSSA